MTRGNERRCRSAVISTAPVSSTPAAIQMSLEGMGVPTDFRKENTPRVEFPCFARDGQDGNLFHLQKGGKSLSRHPLALRIALRAGVNLSAYDGRNENLLDVL